MAFLKNRSVAVITFLYFTVMFVALMHFGVNSNGEAEKYFNDARSIIAGAPFNDGVFSLFYMSYSLLLSIFVKLSIGLWWLGLLQIIVSFCAACALYRLLQKRSTGDVLATIGFALYLFCYPIQKWNLFVYSEGLHTSLTVIGLYLFFQMLEKVSAKRIILFGILLLLVITSRPAGIIFLLSCFSTLTYFLFRQKNIRMASLLFAAILLAFIGLLNSPYRFFINPDSLRRMEVICEVPQAAAGAHYTEYNRAGLGEAWLVVKNEIGFGNFIRNGFLKLRSFFGLTRPFYSTRNNMFLALYLFLYPFAIAGAFFYRRKIFSPVNFFCIFYIGLTAAGIFVTCDDWSDRFIAPVFPFIIITAAAGVYVIRQRFLNRPSS